MLTSHTQHSLSNRLLLFRDLAALPCGCVAVAYVARPLSLDVVAVEAKGPHCTLGHPIRVARCWYLTRGGENGRRFECETSGS